MKTKIGRSPSNIHFGHVQIREYARCVGDNPSCRAGPPLSISWEYDPNPQIFSLDEYESWRVGNRRSDFEMIMPKSLRTDLLKKEWDVSQSEIAAAVRSALRTKSQRRTTFNNMNRSFKADELVEKVCEEVKRTLCYKKSVDSQVEELERKLDEVNKMRSESFSMGQHETIEIKEVHQHITALSEGDDTPLVVLSFPKRYR